MSTYSSTTIPYPDRTPRMARMTATQAATENSTEKDSTELASFSLIESNLFTEKEPTSTGGEDCSNLAVTAFL